MKWELKESTIWYHKCICLLKASEAWQHSGEVIRTTALGKCCKRKKKQTSLCASHWVVFCRPLRDKSAEIPAQPFDVLLRVMMATAALCMACKSPLVHVFVSAPPSYPFFLPRPPIPHHLSLISSSCFSSPPSFWSIWSIARKPGNQSGRFLFGTTAHLFFCHNV